MVEASFAARRGRRLRTVAERLWAKVERGGPDDCWEWRGTCTTGPRNMRYGSIKVDGKMVRAHRVAWEIENGAIPEGLCVLHRCDNPTCCNPAHLFVGTYADNNHDAVKKGRHRGGRGERNGAARLTEERVRAIRARQPRGAEVLDMAREYGVRIGTIYEVLRGQTWKDA